MASSSEFERLVALQHCRSSHFKRPAAPQHCWSRHFERLAAQQEPEPASAQPAGEAGAAEAEVEAARASATQWEPLFPWGLSHEELAPLLSHFALAGHSADVARTCTARAVASGQAGRKAW